ncbi:MAG: HAD family hydrolase [Nanoarchaeota archaeon]|nr:HAD family hydrolase [Nanoarchaeota archaeon]MBU1322025.1 HAD family hydrolase [Nanoarchaeota archaeon]MBU1598110.1 HAD family hydrolase [Nanoarchaeota archaeon]MBU2441761.1 HAD family hydrolase [Nanoarchaeota archaeon]
MIEGIIFDYDGTIGMTLERQHNWFMHWAKLNNISFPLTDFNEFKEVYNQILNEKGIQAFYDQFDLPCKMNDLNHPVWIAYNSFKKDNPVKYYPGIKEAIKKIHKIGELSEDSQRNQRLRMIINTNNSWGSIYSELKKQKILGLFDSFVTKEVLVNYHGAGKGTAITKPSKISVALALNILNTDGGATIHVGDTLTDLAASIDVRRHPQIHRKERLITIGAGWGYESVDRLNQGLKTEIGTEHFNHVLEEPAMLPEVIKQYM